MKLIVVFFIEPNEPSVFELTDVIPAAGFINSFWFVSNIFGITSVDFNPSDDNLFAICLTSNGFENIDLNLFFDAATLREVDYDSSLESSKIRSATGIAVNWFTVIGPLSFSYAIPITKETTDATESFRFRIGTSF